LVALIAIALVVMWLMSRANAPTAPVTVIPSTTTQQASSTSTQPAQAVNPQIISIDPSHGLSGSIVTIHGKGFTTSGNLIMFGPSNNRHHLNGTADNVIANATSTDGTTLTFIVPTSGPSGILCAAPRNCIAISAIRLMPGAYPVSVSNARGTSNVAVFTIESK